MPKRFWWPGSIPEQLTFIEHFSRCTAGLGLTPDQATAAGAVSAASLTAMNPTDHLRNHISFGRAERLAAPVFPFVRPALYTIGLGSQFFELRDHGVGLSDQCEPACDDRNVAGSEFDELDPFCDQTTTSGYWVIISGSTRSKSAMPV